MLSLIKKIITNIREAHIPQWILWLITICAGIGFLDATYLSIEHVITANGGSVFCIVGAPGSCNIVLQSIYSKIYGIPLSYLGLLYYTTILIIITRLHSVRSTRLWHLLQGIITFGFLMSLYLVYLQLFILRTICPYCMLSAAMSIIMFIGVVFHRLRK
jgi:uncharacterized membrane protein